MSGTLVICSNCGTHTVFTGVVKGCGECGVNLVDETNTRQVIVYEYDVNTGYEHEDHHEHEEDEDET